MFQIKEPPTNEIAIGMKIKAFAKASCFILLSIVARVNPSEVTTIGQIATHANVL